MGSYEIAKEDMARGEVVEGKKESRKLLRLCIYGIASITRHDPRIGALLSASQEPVP